MAIVLRESPLPRPDLPATPPPALPARVYEGRHRALRKLAGDRDIDLLLVWGDREHAANVSYLTGCDPRFEETLLIMSVSGKRPPRLLVGNECWGYATDPGIGLEIELWQDFSLLGQPRDKSRSLLDILTEEGLQPGVRVGCIGMKTYSPGLISSKEAPQAADLVDLPAFLVDLLRKAVGEQGAIINSTGLLMDVDDGLRIINEPEQIRLFEYAACITSAGIMSLLEAVRPGIREDELERLLDSRGIPLSCHRMVGFGDKARRGLASASANAASRGDVFTAAFGVEGALTCRAGVVAGGPQELPEATREFYPRLIENYFEVVQAWYHAVRVGATGGEVFAATDSVRDPALFDFALNPGHYLHLDEWVNSPFSPGSPTPLRSGMAIQMDIIPISKGPFLSVNMEDGIVLADHSLRERLWELDPGLMHRVNRRRSYMIEQLGFQLDESLLPLGDTSGWLPPYAGKLSQAMARI